MSEALGSRHHVWVLGGEFNQVEALVTGALDLPVVARIASSDLMLTLC